MRNSSRLPAALLLAFYSCCRMMAGVDSCNDCVREDLASVHMYLEKSTFRAGHHLTVSVVLTAGSKGVYLPAYFGDFAATCLNGFDVALLTPQGGLADPNAKGCAGSVGHSARDTAVSELHNFVYLKPGEERTWRTEVSTTGIKPGKYYLLSEYLSSGYMIQEVAKLPQVNGLMAIGRIHSKRIEIRIIQ